MEVAKFKDVTSRLLPRLHSLCTIHTRVYRHGLVGLDFVKRCDMCSGVDGCYERHTQDLIEHHDVYTAKVDGANEYYEYIICDRIVQ